MLATAAATAPALGLLLLLGRYTLYVLDTELNAT